MCLRRFSVPLYKKLLVASAKGGVGKSTTVLGLAAEFAKMGKKTLICDLDYVSRSLDLLAGAADTAIFDMGDIIDGGEITPVTPFEKLPKLSFIAACAPAYASHIAKDSAESIACLLRRALERIIADADYDILICDTGAGTETARTVAELFDMVLIVSEQGKTSVRAADYAAAELLHAGARCLRLVICSFDIESVKREHRAGVIEIIDASEIRCIGVVPYDKSIQKAQDSGRLPSVKASSSIAYGNMAKRISGSDVPLFDGMKSYRKRMKRAL